LYTSAQPMKNHQQVDTATHMDLVGIATSSKKGINEKTPANYSRGFSR
jgi:hypothetical protein